MVKTSPSRGSESWERCFVYANQHGSTCSFSNSTSSLQPSGEAACSVEWIERRWSVRLAKEHGADHDAVIVRVSQCHVWIGRDVDSLPVVALIQAMRHVNSWYAESVAHDGGQPVLLRSMERGDRLRTRRVAAVILAVEGERSAASLQHVREPVGGKVKRGIPL
eukprot:scaffold2249_cov272-Pinguiococcus_pyrenoidosus.AAC.10